MSNSEPTLWSRRAALGVLGGAGVTLAASGCKVQTKAKSGPTVDAGGVTIPDPKVKLPTDEVTFHWMDTGDRKALFEKPVFEAYHKKHSNITIDYTANPWKTLNEVIPLGIRNGTAPDAFLKPNNITEGAMVSQGWVQPLQDLLPDFDTWRKAFPDGTLVPGVHVFDDLVYTFPLTSSGQLFQMLWYDVKVLDTADVGDPDDELKTWDQFRTAAQKVTKAGNGKVYGVMTDQLMNDFVVGFAQSAGWNTLAGMDPKTGRYAYSAQPVLDAIELGMALKSDGCFFPDYGSLTQADAGGRMPNSVAGMAIQGPWYYQTWEQDSPDWKFDVLPMPTPDGKGVYYRNWSQGGGNDTWINAKSKHPEIAADLLSYIGSIDGQTQLVIMSQGSLVPPNPKAIEKAKASGEKLDPYAVKIMNMSNDHARIGPTPAVRNSETDRVKMALKPVSPAFDDILQGLFSGQVKDAKKALTKLDSDSEKALDQAIAAARKKGADVSRDDYVFQNFDPSRDYTQADYDAL